MMTEQQGDDHKGPWGVLNDWDHALWTDASPTDRVVRIFRHIRVSLSMPRLAGHLAVHLNQTARQRSKTSRHFRRPRVFALGHAFPRRPSLQT